MALLIDIQDEKINSSTQSEYSINDIQWYMVIMIYVDTSIELQWTCRYQSDVNILQRQWFNRAR